MIGQQHSVTRHGDGRQRGKGDGLVVESCWRRVCMVIPSGGSLGPGGRVNVIDLKRVLRGIGIVGSCWL